MLRTRVMPCLLIMNTGLYKTIRFKNPTYIGDPINAIRIYNNKEVDELILLDITATQQGKEPNFSLIADVASECFMPLSYGGGIRNLDHVKRIFEIGVEKISVNTAAIETPQLIRQIADTYGSQSVIVSMDVKKNFWGKHEVATQRATKLTGENPVEFARRMEDTGAGEILVTSVDKEGTWDGYDIDLLHKITSAISIPVICNGGAGSLQHVQDVVDKGGVSGVALGSMAVYQKKGMGVLISFPPRKEIEKLLSEYHES